MRPTIIFVDAHQFDYGFDGAASFIQGLYLALVRQRPGEFRILLGCADPDKVLASFEGDQHFEAISYGTISRARRLLYQIPKTIASARPDLAHFQYFTPLVKTCPWVVTIHDVLFNDFPQYFPPGYATIRNVMFPISAHRADLLTTVSNYSKERISTWYRIPYSSIEVVPNGVRRNRAGDALLPLACAEVAALISLPDGYFLCVSRFEPRKNQATVLQAYVDSGLWRRNIELVFVGVRTLSSSDFDATLAQVPTGVRGKIRFLEGLSFIDLERLYANATAAIYPSLAEGFGMPPLEAAVAGTPSLCAYNTAMIDFTPLSPYLFDSKDKGKLNNLLQDIVNRPEYHHAQAASIAHEVAMRYSWDAAAQHFGQLIDNLRWVTAA